MDARVPGDLLYETGKFKSAGKEEVNVQKRPSMATLRSNER